MLSRPRGRSHIAGALTLLRAVMLACWASVSVGACFGAGGGDIEECQTADDCGGDRCADGQCVAATCDDGVRNGEESDVDCGGASCGPCADGSRCNFGSDCTSSSCNANTETGQAGQCLAPTCSDGTRNGSETDIDCGGACATKCANGLGCADDDDCDSFVCGSNNECAGSQCRDGVLNGDETDIDCGGSCEADCAAGRACIFDDDCIGRICARPDGVPSSEPGSCVDATCSDNVTNGDETDVDCGGSCPRVCVNGQGCRIGDDCASFICANSFCTSPECDDEIQNGDETDLDCGGSVCAPCAIGDGCVEGRDCQTGVCSVYGACQEAHCFDGVRNGAETDVDCGGPCTADCDPGQLCANANDCTSRVCNVSGDGLFYCSSPTCDDGVLNGGEEQIDCGGACSACP